MTENSTEDSAVDAFLSKMAEFARKEVVSLSLHGDELKAFYNDLKNESSTAVVVKIFSLFDDLFFNAFRQHMPNLDKRSEKDLFGPLGPLATANSRFLLAFTLGWITKDIYDDLSSIRRIRNHFAHALRGISFSEEKIIRQIFSSRRLTKERLLKMIEAAISGDDRFKIGADLDDPRTRFLINSIMLYGEVSVALAVAPIAQSYQVPMGMIAGEHDKELPESVASQMKESIRAVLSLVLAPKEK